MFTYLIALLAIWLVGEIPLGVWVYRAMPSKPMIAKYSSNILLKCLLPFSPKWQRNVAPADLPMFREYQRRAKIWYLSFVFPLLIIYGLLAVSLVVRH